MGEFADMLIDSYYSGGHWEDDYEPYFGSYQRKTIACNKCGCTSVYWHQYASGKWFLFDNSTDKAHVCIKPAEKKVEKKSNNKEISKLRDEINKLKERIEDLEEELEDLTPEPEPKRAMYKGYPSRVIKKAGEPSIEEQYRNASICPSCGTRAGFAFGTGDCGCQRDREMDIWQ